MKIAHSKKKNNTKKKLAAGRGAETPAVTCRPGDSTDWWFRVARDVTITFLGRSSIIF
jgi:hypothetical protein